MKKALLSLILVLLFSLFGHASERISFCITGKSSLGNEKDYLLSVYKVAGDNKDWALRLISMTDKGSANALDLSFRCDQSVLASSSNIEMLRYECDLGNGNKLVNFELVTSKAKNFYEARMYSYELNIDVTNMQCGASDNQAGIGTISIQ